MPEFTNHLSLELSIAFKHLEQQGCLIKQQESSWGHALKGQGRIISDSRDIRPGDIFVAYKGLKIDSHQFIPKVLEKKPGLVIADRASLLSAGEPHRPILCVENSRAAWSYLCSLACGNPQDKLQTAAITGTNGKTSSLWILKSLFEAHNIPYATIGTLGIFLNGQHFQTQHTTPDPPILYQSLKRAVEEGIQVLAMEASSHSIVQEKLSPISFSCLAWTSFSQDHLDFHKTMEAYWQAKWTLFTKNLASKGKAILNKDIKPFPPSDMLKNMDFIRYGIEFEGMQTDLVVNQVTTSRGGTEVHLKYKDSFYQYQIPYWGTHNIENFICALAIFERLTGKLPSPLNTSKLKGVPGRLQQVITSSKSLPYVIIDYAHTPDALEKTINAMRPYCKGKLYVVFGCGGERDQGKRKKMGSIAESYADEVILTSDNPRNEPANNILRDISAGFSKTQPVMIEDRKSAIAWAIANAKPDDFVLVAGKGHEAYQVIGSKVYEFDDYKVAEEILKTESKEYRQ